MQLYPTRMTLHVAVAGAAMVALGAAARLPAVVAFGGAVLLAVAFGRAQALVAITQLRDAGFEMVWSGTSRVHRAGCDEAVVLGAEIHNRSAVTLRCVRLRPVVSSMLVAHLEPAQLDLAPEERGVVRVTVRGARVGRWGVHGLALEVRGASLGGDGLYEVPLLFASPIGVEVSPRPLATFARSARGGRARRAPETGRAGGGPGEGDELRELRDHAPGDPFRRIAWKASARRGQLLVRETEREEREVVWLVVEASVELWAGEPGRAPLDHVVDDVAREAARRLRRGDRVGLAIGASRLLTWLPPRGGAPHASAIAQALAECASCLDADRSDFDEAEIARRVVEHARPLDGAALSDLPRGDLDALARRAEQIGAKAPFAPRAPFADTTREQALRRYLSAFGVEGAPLVDGEHARAEATIAGVLERLAAERRRPTVVRVWAPPPSRPAPAARAILELRARRVEVRWTVPPLDAGVGAERGRRSRVADAVDEAVRARAWATQTRGERLLRRLGVKVEAERVARPAGAQARR